MSQLNIVVALMAALAVSSASAQAVESEADMPDAQYADTTPESSVPPEDGVEIQRAEGEHRKITGALARRLERETLRVKIQEQIANNLRVEGEIEEFKGEGKKLNAAPPAAVPVMAGSPTRAAPAPQQGSAEGNLSLGMAIPPPPPEPGLMQMPPRPIGTIGETVFFQMPGQSGSAAEVSAKVGESVGGFLLSKRDGRRVTLESLTAPKMTVTLQVP